MVTSLGESTRHRRLADDRAREVIDIEVDGEGKEDLLADVVGGNLSKVF